MQERLDPLFRSRSIAIVGASPRGNWQTKIFQNLKRYGYEGDVFPINPNRAEVWGVRCYPDLASLPSPVDHALVMLPSDAAVEFIETAALQGLPAATIYAAGIGEGTDPVSQARAQRLRSVLERYPMRICGPNCMGLMSLRDRLFLYPNSDICRAPVGSTALLFQSGGSLQFWAKTAMDRGLAFSYLVSSGNELAIDAADYLEFFIDDPDTQLIVTFLEGIRRPEAFMAAAARALTAQKPILAVKPGKTEQSRATAYSHTGAIAGDHDVFRAMCDRYGIVVCGTLDDMLETALAFQPRRFPKGPSLGVVTTSGGVVDLLHDHAHDEKMEMPALAAATVEAVKALVIPEVEVKNPLDAAVAGFAAPEAVAQISALFAADPSIDMVAIAAILPTDEKGAKAPDDLHAMVEETAKPVVGFGRMSYTVNDYGRAYMERVGMPFLQGMPETLRALKALSFYGERLGTTIPGLPRPDGDPNALLPGRIDATLAAHGVYPPKSGTASDPAGAGLLAEQIGFPVALKLDAPSLIHKTEVGAVRLNLVSPQDVEVAAKQLLTRCRQLGLDRDEIGFVVQEMVDGVEVIAGVRSDDQFGPVLLVGAGGVLVELVRDATLELLPVSPEGIRNMIARLRVGRLLEGFRGRAPADVDSLIAAIDGLQRFYLRHRTSIAEIEINPLIVRQGQGGVAAVDVRVLRHL